MADVLYQFEPLCAARGVLVQTSGALVLAMDVLGTDDPLPDEPQTCAAPVAAYPFAHDQLDLGSTASRST